MIRFLRSPHGFETATDLSRRRSAGAARSLGQIDPEGNKQILLKALNPVTSNYYLIRVFAAEGLARTKDTGVLKAIEQYRVEEKDSYVRQQFDNASQAMRANGVKP